MTTIDLLFEANAIARENPPNPLRLRVALRCLIRELADLDAQLRNDGPERNEG